MRTAGSKESFPEWNKISIKVQANRIGFNRTIQVITIACVLGSRDRNERNLLPLSPFGDVALAAETIQWPVIVTSVTL